MRFIFLFSFFLIGLLTQEVQAFNIDNIVGNLQHTYQTAVDWQADFSQSTFVELLGKNIEKSGHISIKKPGKLRIEYKGEGERVYISNGKKLWIVTPGDSEVEVYPKLSKILAREALTFLEGLGDIRHDFSVNAVTLAESKNSEMQDHALTLLRLTPVHAGSLFQKIILGVDPKNYQVREMTLVNMSNNKTHYIFNNIRFNSRLADGLFEYQQ